MLILIFEFSVVELCNTYVLCFLAALLFKVYQSHEQARGVFLIGRRVNARGRRGTGRAASSPAGPEGGFDHAIHSMKARQFAQMQERNCQT